MTSRVRWSWRCRHEPDLIVLGGDYVTYGDRDFVEPVAELLAPLRAPQRRLRDPRQP